MTSTKVSELPLYYKHDSQPGTLLFSYACNDKGPVKGWYIYCIQTDDGQILDKGTIKGIKNINILRDEFILKGWKRIIRPKVELKEKNKKKEQTKPIEAIPLPPNEENDKARQAAFAAIHSKVYDDSIFF